MRKRKYLATMIEMMQKYDADLVAPDQDYLNVILKGEIKFFGEEWNAEPKKDLPARIKLVHFNLFNKPWHYKNVPGERIFWAAAKGTGFYGELRRQREGFSEEKQKAEQEKVRKLIEKAGRLAKGGRIFGDYLGKEGER